MDSVPMCEVVVVGRVSGGFPLTVHPDIGAITGAGAAQNGNTGGSNEAGVETRVFPGEQDFDEFINYLGDAPDYANGPFDDSTLSSTSSNVEN
jgi:hypothetical protein